jgi:tetratricopeptide (TPR) repeat protein
MSELRLGTFEMPAGKLGDDNPLPPLFPPSQYTTYAASNIPVPPENWFGGYGTNIGRMPYCLQDNYDRRRRKRSFKVAILENDCLRATFLLELGGRLWSLYHKQANRELLYVNPVFQPANLAMRDAWFSGGVEWNAAVRAHTPFTCSPIFAARVDGDDGSPVLRLYEWERIRGVPYQIDFHLPDGSQWLLVRVRLTNPYDEVIPTYWWSNVAIPELDGGRMIIPGDSVYTWTRQRGYGTRPIIADSMYPKNAVHGSFEQFFHIPADRRPFMMQADREGTGLIQCSTANFRGRKFFVWGQWQGGKRWQEFLSVPGRPYFEMQAGLAPSQNVCLPMPAKAQWSWLEAYGLMEADPAAAHNPDFDVAWRHVHDRLDAALPIEFLEREHMRLAPVADRPPSEILHRGSGWGALERRRRLAMGEPAFCGSATPFDDQSLGEAQEPWLSLLTKGEFTCPSPAQPPKAWMIQSQWRDMLQQSLRRSGIPARQDTQPAENWFAYLHLGTMLAADKQFDAARIALEKSLQLSPSAWAYRNLGELHRHLGDFDKAAEFHFKALELMPDMPALAIECFNMLINTGRANQVAQLAAKISDKLLKHGRIQVLLAKAAVESGNLEAAEKLLASKISLPDVREGERILTDLWFALHERKLAAATGKPIDDELRAKVRKEFPPPAYLDFRMAEE